MTRQSCTVAGCVLGEHRPGHPHLTATGDALKAAGIAAAATAERVQTWKESAEARLQILARSGLAFTADTLVAAVGLPDTGVNRNNAVGAIINGAARRGLIRKTGEYVKSSRPGGHSRIIAVWIRA